MDWLRTSWLRCPLRRLLHFAVAASLGEAQEGSKEVREIAK